MALVETRKSVALHLRGIPLPEGIERDIFVVDGRITFQAPEQVSTVFAGGYAGPG